MAKKTDERYTHGRAARRRKKNRRKYTVYYILAAVMMLAIGAALSLTVFFNITVISVAGDTRYDSEDIIDASDVLIGDNLFRLIGSDVKDNIVSEFPYIEDVKIQRVLPEELVIKVIECKPAVTVEREDEYLLLSDKGRMLEEISVLPEDSARIIGFAAESMQPGDWLSKDDNERFELLLQMLQIMEQYGLQDIAVMDMRDMLNLRLLYDGRMDIQLGSSADIEYKLRAVKSIIDTAVEKRTVGLIDVSSRDSMRMRELNIYQEGNWNFPQYMLEDYKRQISNKK